PASQHADAGVLPRLGQRVAWFQALGFPTEICRHLCAEVIGERKKDLRSEPLQERTPRLAGKRRSERADALRGDDGDAPRLAREREELLVAGRLVLARRGERLIFVAHEEDRPSTGARI